LVAEDGAVVNLTIRFPGKRLIANMGLPMLLDGANIGTLWSRSGCEIQVRTSLGVHHLQLKTWLGKHTLTLQFPRPGNYVALLAYSRWSGKFTLESLNYNGWESVGESPAFSGGRRGAIPVFQQAAESPEGFVAVEIVQEQRPVQPFPAPEIASQAAQAVPAAVANTTATPPLGSRFRAVGKWLWGGLAAAAHPLDALLRRLVGEQNDLLRYFLWAALPLLLLFAVWARFWALTPSPAPWKLRPIAPQTIEVGNELTVAVTVENADAWQGKLRYGFGGQAPPGVMIDPQAGRLTWTPSKPLKPESRLA
jgi:hypothetical protein